MPETQRPESTLNAIAVLVGRIAGWRSLFRPVKTQRTGHRHNDVRFEHSDISAGGTFLTGVGVLVGLWISIGLIFLWFSYLRAREAKSSPPPLPIALHGDPEPPEPRLQRSPPQDLKALLARENWELEHYYWVDKDKGKIAIPIDRAMQIIVQRGIPPGKMPPNATLTPPQAASRTTGLEGTVEPEPR